MSGSTLALNDPLLLPVLQEEPVPSARKIRLDLFETRQLGDNLG